MIARYADGALRDALSLLDRCSAKGETITPDVVSACAGIAGKAYLFQMADCIAANNAADALRLIGNLHAASCNMERLCVELTEHFRNLMVTKVVRDPQNLIICSKEDLESYRKQCGAFTLETILHVLNVLGDTTANLKRGLDRKIETEMAVLRLCTPSLSTDPDAILRRVSELERKLASGTFSVQPEPAPAEPQRAEEPEPAPAVSEPAPEPQAAEKPAETEPKPASSLFKLWPEALLILKETCKPISGLLVGSSAYVFGSTLRIKSSNAAVAQFLDIPLYAGAIQSAVEKVSGQKMHIELYDTHTEEKKSDPLENLIRKIDTLQ